MRPCPKGRVCSPIKLTEERKSVLESLKGMLMDSKRVRVRIKRFLEKGRGSAAPEEGRGRDVTSGVCRKNWNQGLGTALASSLFGWGIEGAP